MAIRTSRRRTWTGSCEAGFSFRGNYVFGGNSGAVCVPSRAMLMSGKTWFNVDTPTLNGAQIAAGSPAGKRLCHVRHRQVAQRPALVAAGVPARKSHHVRRHVRPHQGARSRPGPRWQADGRAAPARNSPASCLRTPRSSSSRTTTGKSRSSRTSPSPRRTIRGSRRRPTASLLSKACRGAAELPAAVAVRQRHDERRSRRKPGAWPRTEAMIRDQLAEYYGLITHMDEQIGRILAALKSPARRTTRSSFLPPTTDSRSAATDCWASKACSSTACAPR